MPHKIVQCTPMGEVITVRPVGPRRLAESTTTIGEGVMRNWTITARARRPVDTLCRMGLLAGQACPHRLRNSKRVRVRGHGLSVLGGQPRVVEENMTKVVNEDKTRPSMSE